MHKGRNYAHTLWNKLKHHRARYSRDNSAFPLVRLTALESVMNNKRTSYKLSRDFIEATVNIQLISRTTWQVNWNCPEL